MEPAPKTAEELELEKVVFGDFEEFNNALGTFDDGESSGESAAEIDDDEPVDPDSLFFVDKEGDQSGSDVDMSEGVEDSDTEVSDAWEDSDDERITVSLATSNKVKKLRNAQDESTVTGRDYEKRLRAQFLKLHPQPKWAQISRVLSKDNTNEDEDEEMQTHDDEAARPKALAEMLSSMTSFAKPKSMSRLLPTSDLDIGRLQDITRQQTSKSAIQSLQFHQSHPLALTGGYDQTLRIYHVDGKTNPVATSLHIRESPFQTSLFHPDGRRVFAGGRRKYFYIWDLESGGIDKIARMYGHEDTQRSMEKFVISPDGKYVGLVGNNGWMNVLSADNGQWVAGAKVDGQIADLVWNSDETVTIASRGGDIYEWDSRARKTRTRWRDQAGVGITSLAQTDRWCAVGAANGMVNVYDRTNPKHSQALSGVETAVLEPKYVIDNLVTTVSSLQFSPDGQILAMASRAARDALKMVHVPSFSVFRNWPTSVTPLGRVTSIAFSPGTQMFATGNEQGYARLFSINHYA